MITFRRILVDIDALAPHYSTLTRASEVAEACRATMKVVDVLPYVPNAATRFVTPPAVEAELVGNTPSASCTSCGNQSWSSSSEEEVCPVVSGAIMNPAYTSPSEPPSLLATEDDFRDERFERISMRAHELYEARGGAHGQDLDDWLQAEQQIEDEIGGLDREV